MSNKLGVMHVNANGERIDERPTSRRVLITDPIPATAQPARRPASITVDTLAQAISTEVERIGADKLLADMETHRANRLAQPKKPVGYRKVRLYKAGGGAKECARRLARQMANAQD